MVADYKKLPGVEAKKCELVLKFGLERALSKVQGGTALLQTFACKALGEQLPKKRDEESALAFVARALAAAAPEELELVVADYKKLPTVRAALAKKPPVGKKAKTKGVESAPPPPPLPAAAPPNTAPTAASGWTMDDDSD